MSLIKEIKTKVDELLNGYNYTSIIVSDNESRGVLEVEIKFNPPIDINEFNKLIVGIRNIVKEVILRNQIGLRIPSIVHTFSKNSENKITSAAIIIEVN